MNPEKWLDRIIQYSFYLLIFLVPLILLPYNYELFEFNKIVLVYGLTIVIITSWIAKWILNGKIEIIRTPLDVPIGIFLASQILSTIFSINPHTSIWGYYSRFNGGLLSTISYILLYYAFVGNMVMAQGLKLNAKSYNLKQLISCLYFLLASGFIVTSYGILEHFGIDAHYWVQDVRNRVFSTLGQPNWLGAWIDGVILIPIALVIFNNHNRQISGVRIKKSNFQFSIFNFQSPSFLFLVSCYLLLVTCYLCLLFTGSRSAYIGFITASAVFGGILVIKNTQLVKKLLPALGIIVLISFIAGTPFTPSVFQIAKGQQVNPQPNYGDVPPLAQTISSSTDIRKVVWKGALEVWKHYPIFGSGVETFGYSYFNYRSTEHNQLSEWDFLYNKAHNEYLNYLATTGIVGLGSYLLLIIATLYWMAKIFNLQFTIFIQKSIFKKNKNENLNIENSLKIENWLLIISLISGYASILVTNFFGFSVVPVALLFWLFPAFIFSLNPSTLKKLTMKQCNNEAIKKLKVLKYLLLIILLVVSCKLLVVVTKYWLADYYFNQGRKSAGRGNFLPTFKDLVKATQLNNSEPFFKIELGKNAAMIAAAYHQQDASGSAQLISEFSQLAVQETNQGLKLNPYHLNYLKTASQNYLYLSAIDRENLIKSLKIMSRARELSPTDPKITLNLASLYQQIGDEQTAINYLEKTVQLKPNYILGQLSLAKTYYKAGETQKAIDQLKFLLEKVDDKNPEAKTLLKEWKIN